MIVKIDLNAFYSENDVELASLSEIFRQAVKRRFLLDTSNLLDPFPEITATRWFTQFLSNNEQDQIIELLNYIEGLSAYITDIHKKYLRTITIGFNDAQINPTDASSLLQAEANIILENQVNDFKFIRGLVEKYTNHKTRKTIYQLLQKAFDNNWIVPDNAGGKGEIIKLINSWIERRGELYKMKLATVFDSDRSDPTTVPPEQQLIIKFLKGLSKEEQLADFDYQDTDMIVWHMLAKKEIENYLPLDLIEKHFPQLADILEKLRQLSEAELDFQDYKVLFPDVRVKTAFPELFTDTSFRRDKFEELCKHHEIEIELPNNSLEKVSEFEGMLLKFIKLI